MSDDNATVGRKRSRPEDWGEIDPSPVVHIRGLPRHSVELDVVKVFQPYGRIRDVAMMPQKNQALVEFEDISSAEELIKINPAIKILSSPVQISFSTSKHIVQRAANRAPADEQNSLSTDNHILLFTIYDTDRPITVETIYRITFSYGNVLRIVIFRKSQVQAMVEFGNIQEARKAKLHLNGADIFPGCCTLKVDYARPARLTVPRNDQDNWDFEKCEYDPSCNYQGDHCQNSLLGYMDDSHYGYDYHYGPYPYDYSNDYGQPHPSECKNMPMGPHNMTLNGARNKSRNSNSTSVVMLYNIDMNKMNCDRIFNILCIYGNVIRVKFLRSKEGSAMVEMGDADSATRLIRNLSGVSFMGNQLMHEVWRNEANVLPLCKGQVTMTDKFIVGAVTFTNSYETKCISRILSHLCFIQTIYSRDLVKDNVDQWILVVNKYCIQKIHSSFDISCRNQLSFNSTLHCKHLNHLQLKTVVMYTSCLHLFIFCPFVY